MPTQSRTQAGAFQDASAAQTLLANSVIHQFTFGANPQPDWTLAQFEAVEVAYDGYAPITMTTWNAPGLAPGSGWLTYGPQVTFRWTFSTGVTAAVGGYFIVTSGGVIRDYVVYDAAVSMNGPGAIDVQTPVEVFPATPTTS